MTDVTAQAFREAAKVTANIQDARLLLAAAEQREQLDHMERYERTHLGNLDDLREQIATLTNEHDEDKRYAEEQIATLTAERDEARATLAQVREIADKQIGVFDSDEVRAEILALIETPNPSSF